MCVYHRGGDAGITAVGCISRCRRRRPLTSPAGRTPVQEAPGTFDNLCENLQNLRPTFPTFPHCNLLPLPSFLPRQRDLWRARSAFAREHNELVTDGDLSTSAPAATPARDPSIPLRPGS